MKTLLHLLILVAITGQALAVTNNEAYLDILPSYKNPRGESKRREADNNPFQKGEQVQHITTADDAQKDLAEARAALADALVKAPLRGIVFAGDAQTATVILGNEVYGVRDQLIGVKDGKVSPFVEGYIVVIKGITVNQVEIEMRPRRDDRQPISQTLTLEDN
jgi:hypothetical protein